MQLKTLYLHNFRIYEEELFEFGPRVNVIRGANARGKTSILEAIYFLMTGRSFRTAQVGDMIRHGAAGFYLDATFVKHDIEQKLRISCNGKERKIVYNNTPYTSSTDLLGVLHGTVIHPDDAVVVKGAPEARRHLLDMQIAQSNPLYVHYYTRYNRAMRQRNHLLRMKNPATIESWEYEMANAGAYLVQQRVLTIEALQSEGRRLHHVICSGVEELGLAYKTGAFAREERIVQMSLDRLRSAYLEHYRQQRRREMELGVTLTGPHKDDMLITLGGKESRFFASEGQQRSCVAALRLAEWECLKQASMETPLMLIDDVGMSLDRSRREQLFNYFALLQQVFLTTTEALAIEGDPRVIEV